jgi:hypothetical protein
MKITTKNGQSIASQLSNIVNNALPKASVTGLSKDLGVVKTDPKSKGKSVLFTWRKGTYRLSENLKVTELDFTNTYVENEVTRETEALIKLHVGITVSEAVKTPVVEQPTECTTSTTVTA